MANPALDTIRDLRKLVIGKATSSPLSPSTRSASSRLSSTFSNPENRMETIPETSKSDLSETSPEPRLPEFISDTVICQEPAELSSDSFQTPAAPPPAPPLPESFSATPRTPDPAPVKTRSLSSSSYESNGRHTCPHGISFPPLDELLRFGRVSNSQLRDVEQNFNSDEFHCLSHFICEGIYKISTHTQSENLAIEDFVPLARNEFSLNLSSAVENTLRSRRSLQNDRTIDNGESSNSPRHTPRRHWTAPSSNADLPTRLRSHSSSLNSGKHSAPNSNLSSDSQSEDDPPVLNEHVRVRPSNAYPESFQSNPLSIETPTGYTARVNIDFLNSVEENMLNLLQHCSLPLLFPNVRLTFLHYLHQSLYSLHLLNHVKVQSYPKNDLLDLLIVGRELCDLRRHRKNSIKNIEFFGIFLKQTLSTRRRKVRTNPFAVPSLKQNITVSSELVLLAFDSLHSEYKIAWNSHFPLMITPPFI